MNILYFDTCALAKRYCRECGHRYVKNIINNPSNEIVFCNLGAVEIASVLAKKARENDGDISRTNAKRRLSRFLHEGKEQYTLMPVTDQIWSKAVGITFKHGLKSLDAIHLAAALKIKQEYPTLQMVTADNKLHDAADMECLKPINPLK